jgi:hypothetical protein
MKFTSMVYSDASGSIGGVTYSRNRFGLYTRAKASPVNPNTSYQQQARSRLALYAAAWANLSNSERATWAAWAAIVLKTDPLGQTHALTPFNWFIAVNTQRSQASQLAVATAPASLALTTFSTCTMSAAAAGNTLSIVYDNTDPWASEDSGFLSVFVSNPVPATRNFIKGPFRYRQTLEGSTTTPPTSPLSVALGYDLVAGQKVFARLIVQDGLGAPSNPQLLAAIAV